MQHRVPANGKCPVTVLTGFLGSGKTTLLNALIRGRQDLRIAVIVNEFGELGIDAGMIEASEEDVIELSNGCLCCNVRGDLAAACERLARRRSEFDWLVIETSGLADPAPIAQSFLIDGGPGEAFRLDGIVTLVDARSFWQQSQQSETVWRQIALADRILLTKTDIVDQHECERISDRLRMVNSAVDILQSSIHQPGIAPLIGLAAYDLGHMPERICFVPAPIHDAAISAEGFQFSSPFDFTAFSRFMKLYASIKGDDLLRVKGILDLAGENRRFAFHGVQGMIDGDVLDSWGGARRHSRLMFIGRNLDRSTLQAVLRNCLA